jgi:tetratricopeptide (TPR) repeat protein
MNYPLHVGIAEQGKIFFVEKNYPAALKHFREALKLSQGQASSDIFFQHYSQCIMEALEMMGAHAEVIDFCEKIIEFLEDKGDDQLVALYRASLHERLAVQALFLQEKDEAKAYLLDAQKIAGKGRLKLTDELLSWMLRGYAIQDKQVKEIQRKHKYFIITPDSIQRGIAQAIPSMV